MIDDASTGWKKIRIEQQQHNVCTYLLYGLSSAAPADPTLRRRFLFSSFPVLRSRELRWIKKKQQKNLWVETFFLFSFRVFSFLLKENGRRALSCHSNNDVNLSPFFCVLCVHTRHGCWQKDNVKKRGNALEVEMKREEKIQPIKGHFTFFYLFISSVGSSPTGEVDLAISFFCWYLSEYVLLCVCIKRSPLSFVDRNTRRHTRLNIDHLNHFLLLSRDGCSTHTNTRDEWNSSCCYAVGPPTGGMTSDP